MPYIRRAWLTRRHGKLVTDDGSDFQDELRFPDNVFFTVGNHDSFLHEIMKRGVPQGLLWEKHVAVLTRRRVQGRGLELFYQQSPLLVVSKDFIACHAGPARRKISRQMLVDAHQFPDIIHDMTLNRFRTPASPPAIPVVMFASFARVWKPAVISRLLSATTPAPSTSTLWLNVGQINQHHVVISSRPGRVGIFICIDGKMVPQIYPG